MGISPFDIYFIGLADSLKTMFEAVAGISFIMFTLGTLAYFFFNDEYMVSKDVRDRILPPLKKGIKILPWVVIAGAFLAILTPSSKTLAAMLVIPKLANSEIVSKDLPKAGKAMIEMATEWMKAQTENLKTN